MGIPDTQPSISVEEYIQGEQPSEVRHECIGGQVYAMSGVSGVHNTICLNQASAIRQHVPGKPGKPGKPCKVLMTDMKLRLNNAEDDVFYYPDLLVAGDPDDGRRV
jgi:Uma2 family endonuclease